MEATCERGQGPEEAVVPWMDGSIIYPFGDESSKRGEEVQESSCGQCCMEGEGAPLC